MSQAGLWDNPENAQKVLQEAKRVKEKIEAFESMYTQWEELTLLGDMALEEKDQSIYKELKAGILSLADGIDSMRLATLLKGEYDGNNAILTVHAGAGGTDAQDWAEMLLRMYKRWCENKGYAVKTLDYLADTEGGIKSVVLLISGTNAYGFLKSEKGVHRLVRISPYDTANRRHTSFASIDVMPELDETTDIEINPSELKIDTYRASGAGGQHINKTESAVRITHIPTGVVVQCQNERSQHSNKSTAMKMLMAKLVELKEQENIEKVGDLKGDYSQISWGSQIRSYVFHPYSLVKDHRTNAENGNVGAVMDGDIDLFINEYLKQKA